MVSCSLDNDTPRYRDLMMNFASRPGMTVSRLAGLIKARIEHALNLNPLPDQETMTPELRAEDRAQKQAYIARRFQMIAEGNIEQLATVYFPWQWLTDEHVTHVYRHRNLFVAIGFPRDPVLIIKVDAFKTLAWYTTDRDAMPESLDELADLKCHRSTQYCHSLTNYALRQMVKDIERYAYRVWHIIQP
jgi:hypothetical protein